MELNLDIILKSGVYLKIIAFFHENQASIDTARGVATWTGYDKETVKKALSELSKKGILVAHRATSTIGYSYTQDKRITEKIEKKLKKLKTRG